MRLNHATLRQIRRQARLSTTELAAMTVVDGKPMARSHLSNLENGNRPATPAAIVALADALKVSPFVLLGPENPKVAIRELVDQLGLTEADLFGSADGVVPAGDVLAVAT
jgi:transcriptional regulator with XRE-family HTH domain